MKDNFKKLPEHLPLIVLLCDLVSFMFVMIRLYDFSSITNFDRLLIYGLFMCLFCDCFLWGEKEFLYLQIFKAIVLMFAKDFLLPFFITLVFIYIDVKIMKSKFTKKKKIMLFLSILIPLFFIVVTIFSNKKEFFFVCGKIYEVTDSFCSFIKGKLNESYNLSTEFSVSTLCTFYFTIFIGLLAIAFTAISIKSSNNLNISDFFHFAFLSKIKELIILIILILCTIIVFVCFLYKIDIFKIKHIVFFLFSYIFCFSSFGIFIYYLFTADNRKRALKILRQHLIKSKNNYREFERLYTEYLKKVFGNGRYSLLEEFSKNLITDKHLSNDTVYRENIIRLLSSDFYIDDRKKKLTEEEYEKGFEIFTKKMFQAIKNFTNDNELRELQLCISNFIKLYIKYIFDNKVNHISHLLQLRDPLYFNILHDEPSEFKDKVIQIYIKILNQSSDLLIYSLRNNTEEDFKSILHDYIYFGQFISDDSINYVYSNQLILIITWIIHSAVHSKIKLDLLKIIPDILKNISELPINDVDNDAYDSEINSIHMEEVKETKNYYIDLMLIYIIDNKDLFNEIFRKIKYHSLNPDSRKWIGHSLLLNELKKIDYSLYSKLNKIDENQFNNDINEFKRHLEREIDNYKRYEINDLRNKVSQEMIEQDAQNQIANIKEEFGVFSTDDESHKGHYRIGSNIFVSYKQILNDPSLHVFGTNFLDLLIHNFLIPLYMRYAQVKYISSFGELSKIIKTDHLFITRALSSDIYRSQEISVGFNTVQIGEREFDFEWIHSNDSGIIEKKDFLNSICLHNIFIDMKNAKTEESKEIPDISVNIPIMFDFGIDISKAKYYSIPK